MKRNQSYVYGPKDLAVPVNLHFGEYVLDNMWENRNKTAFLEVATEESITYGEIVQEAINVSVSLTHMGVRKGQVVGICSENRREFWGTVVGTICSGGVLTTFNPAYVKGEMKHVLEISKPKIIFCSPIAFKTHQMLLKSMSFIKQIILFGKESHNNVTLYNEIAFPIATASEIAFKNNRLTRNVIYEEFQVVPVDGQTDGMLILYSSGTTGLPKGVSLTHLNVLAACCLPATQDPDLATLFISPWFHAMGLVGSFGAMCRGRTNIYLAKFDLDMFLRSIEKYKIQQVTVVPPVLVAANKSPSKYDLSSVTLIYSGAAPLYKENIEETKNKFPNAIAVLQGYGLTEATLALTRSTFLETASKPGCVGKVVSNTVIKVVDPETRKPLGPRQPGEICAKGPSIMKGYIGRDKNEGFDEEGFYKTGDIGYYDEDGYFYIVDRLKELIKYKAYQVPPAEIEAVLLQHEAVRDAGVIGIKHRTAGEVPLAFVAIKPGCTATQKDIQDFIAERLSNPKHLRGGVKFVDQIPKNPSGKILRKELRRMVETKKSKL